MSPSFFEPSNFQRLNTAGNSENELAHIKAKTFFQNSGSKKHPFSSVSHKTDTNSSDNHTNQPFPKPDLAEICPFSPFAPHANRTAPILYGGPQDSDYTRFAVVAAAAVAVVPSCPSSPSSPRAHRRSTFRQNKQQQQHHRH